MIDEASFNTQEPIARVDTQLTFSDYEECAMAVQVEATRARARDPQARTRRLEATVAVIAVAFMIAMAAAAYEPRRAERGEFYFVGTMLVPCVVFAILGSAMSRHLKRVVGTPIPFRRRAAAAIRAFLPWGITAAIIVWLQSRSPRAANASTVDWFGAVYPHFMWVVMASIHFWMIARSARVDLRRLWDGNPSIARLTRIAVNDAGVIFDDGLATRSYRWASFVRFIETAHHFVLCPSELSFETISKAAFADDGSRTEVGALLANRVQPPAQGFPVLPVGVNS